MAGGPAHERTDKLAGIPHETGQTGAPILTEGIAFLECRVKEITSGGDHAVVIGEVVAAGLGKLTDPLTLKETGWHYGG
ncbi:MAG: hypothetical protein COV76_01145 [Candidatus Omnitrophica bacterium CG11_big_fil_rev_8_21_14_0_20_64_10]|nr:MAG: hypothetical protein COV76_01145 [Candidatus Omnitrophica bacterium CG11_big_fil_rev_8_21_14_0_20_64_10]